MANVSTRNSQVRDFILSNIEKHPKDIARFTAESLQLARPTVTRHLDALIRTGLITARGNTKARSYKLKNFVDHSAELDIGPELEEDIEWRQKVLPLMTDVNDNVRRVCQYGFTEMLNNAKDHSEAQRVRVVIRRNAQAIKLMVVDQGVGIFTKLQRHFGLHDPRHVLLELSKGKLTSDPDNHTGEGIFFTSRMFDEFSISSGTLFFKRWNKDDDEWLFEIEDRGELRGTLIEMTIHPQARQTIEEVFTRFSDDQVRFSRTHVPIQLAMYEGEELISRSQAKRILARFERFKEVMLDFRGVTTIGQAFADEIFRIFRREHPEVLIEWLFTTPEIDRTIERALSADSSSEASPAGREG